MTIFVWFMLSLFVLWFVVGILAVYSILTESPLERVRYYHRTGRIRTGEMYMGRVFLATVVPFVGIGACLGYLFG